MRPPALLIALVAVALVAAGCGGASKKSAASTAAGSPPAAAPGAVSMKGLRFHPDQTTVRVGQKATWTNDDNVDPHVTAPGGAKFMAGGCGGGGGGGFTGGKAGTIKYVCTLHPGMVG